MKIQGMYFHCKKGTCGGHCKKFLAHLGFPAQLPFFLYQEGGKVAVETSLDLIFHGLDKLKIEPSEFAPFAPYLTAEKQQCEQIIDITLNFSIGMHNTCINFE